MYDHTTDRLTVQGATFSMRGQLYHGHHLIISPLHGHGEVENENPLILPHTLSIVGPLPLRNEFPVFWEFLGIPRNS